MKKAAPCIIMSIVCAIAGLIVPVAHADSQNVVADMSLRRCIAATMDGYGVPLSATDAPNGDHDAMATWIAGDTVSVSADDLVAFAASAPGVQLWCPDMGIETLDGLEYMADSPYADDIAIVNFSGDSITDASVLAAFSKVTMLDLSGNSITDTSFLASMSILQELRLSSNQITSVDALAQSASPDMWQLWLDSNQISNIDPLAYFPALQDVNLSGNKISDVSPLAGLTQLTSLDISDNEVSDLSAFSGSRMSTLTELKLARNQISDITGIGALTSLQELDLSANSIGDDSSLSEILSLKNLIRLDLYDNQISDITPIADLAGVDNDLWWVNLSANQIYDISALMPFVQWMSQAWSGTNDDSWETDRPDICYQEQCLSLVLDGNFIVNASELPSSFRYSEQLELGVSLRTQQQNEQTTVGTITLPRIKTTSANGPVTWQVAFGPAVLNGDGTVTYTAEGQVLLVWEDSSIHSGTLNGGSIATMSAFSGCVVVTVEKANEPGGSSSTGGEVVESAPWVPVVPVALGVVLLVGTMYLARKRFGNALLS